MSLPQRCCLPLGLLPLPEPLPKLAVELVADKGADAQEEDDASGANCGGREKKNILVLKELYNSSITPLIEPTKGSEYTDPKTN